MLKRSKKLSERGGNYEWIREESKFMFSWGSKLIKNGQIARIIVVNDNNRLVILCSDQSSRCNELQEQHSQSLIPSSTIQPLD